MATFSNLVVKVTADTKRATKEIEDFTSKASKASKRVGMEASSSMKKASDWTKRATNFNNQYVSSLAKLRRAFYLAKFAAAGLFVGLGVNKAIKDVDKLAKTAQKLGMPIEQLQSIQFAAGLAGVGIQTTNLALQRMTRRVAEAAQGTGEAKKALQELGLDAQKLARMSPDQQFRAIAKAMQQVGSQSDRVRLGFKIFDSEGVGLINAMTAELEKAEAKFKRLGVAITRIEANNIENMVDSFSTLGTVIGNTFKKIIAQAAPSLTAAVESVQAFLESSKLIPAVVSVASTAISLFGESVVTVMGGAKAAVDGLKIAFTSIKSGLNDAAIDKLSNELKSRKDQIRKLREDALTANEFQKGLIEQNIKTLIEGGGALAQRSIEQLEKELKEKYGIQTELDSSLKSQTDQLVKDSQKYKESFKRLMGQAADIKTDGLDKLGSASASAAKGLSEFDKLLAQLTGRGGGKQFADQILGKAEGPQSVDQQLSRALLTDIGNSIAQQSANRTPLTFGNVLDQGPLQGIIQNNPLLKGQTASKLSGINQTAGSSFTGPQYIKLDIGLKDDMLDVRIDQKTKNIMVETSQNDKQ